MPDELAVLRRIAARHERIRKDLDAIEEDRDREIRRLVAAKVRVVDIAAAAGIKPPRVYQIRDDRR